MTDPVAEAAAKIAAGAAPSSTEPSLLEKAINTIHDLEAKVEHLIHPEAVSVGIESKPSLGSAPITMEAPAVNGSGEASTSVPLPELPSSADTSTANGSATSSGGEAGNVLAAATASSLLQSSTPAVQTLPETSMQTSTVYSESVESGNVGGRSDTGLTPTPIIGAVEIAAVENLTSTASSTPTSDGMTSNATSGVKAESTPLTTDTTSATDLPNAAPAAVEQLGSQTSAAPVSMPAGIPGIVASSAGEALARSQAAGASADEMMRQMAETGNIDPALLDTFNAQHEAMMAATVKVAEPAKLPPVATSAIKAGVANIKHHLSIRGFEQSAVADIHAELEAIERWL